MEDWEHRLSHLEAANDYLSMQNRALAAALNGLFQALPPDLAEEAARSVQAAFEDEADQLAYQSDTHADLFQDAVAELFRTRR